MSDQHPNDMPPAPPWSALFFWAVVVIGGIWMILYAVYRFRVEEKLPPRLH